MEIDDNLIKQKLDNLEEAINLSDQKTARLRRLRVRLQDVQMSKIPDPSDHTKRIDGIMDDRTNRPMKPDTREEIYTAVMADIDSESV